MGEGATGKYWKGTTKIPRISFPARPISDPFTRAFFPFLFSTAPLGRELAHKNAQTAQKRIPRQFPRALSVVYDRSAESTTQPALSGGQYDGAARKKDDLEEENLLSLFLLRLLLRIPSKVATGL